MAGGARLKTLLQLLICLNAVGVASARTRPPEERARSLAITGGVRFDLGKFAEAAAAYVRANELAPRPEYLLAIGKCYSNLSRFGEAISYYRLYLEQVPCAANRAEVESELRFCVGELGKRARAAGRSPPPAVALARCERIPRPADRGGAWRSGPGIKLWVGVGVTGGLLAAGVVTWALALSKSAEFKDPETPLPRQIELRDSGRTLRAISWVSLGLAAAGAAATALYYVISGGGARPAKDVSIAPLRGGAALSLRGRY